MLRFPYFRSRDLWGGFPANLAAISILQEYMASEIGVEVGEIIASSKGLHLYSYVKELAEILRGKTIDESRREKMNKELQNLQKKIGQHIKKIEQCKNNIAKERDKLCDLESEIASLIESVDDSIDCFNNSINSFEDGIDFLSKYL